MSLFVLFVWFFTFCLLFADWSACCPRLFVSWLSAFVLFFLESWYPHVCSFLTLLLTEDENRIVVTRHGRTKRDDVKQMEENQVWKINKTDERNSTRSNPSSLTQQVLSYVTDVEDRWIKDGNCAFPALNAVMWMTYMSLAGITCALGGRLATMEQLCKLGLWI